MFLHIILIGLALIFECFYLQMIVFSIKKSDVRITRFILDLYIFAVILMEFYETKHYNLEYGYLIGLIVIVFYH